MHRMRTVQSWWVIVVRVFDFKCSLFYLQVLFSTLVAGSDVDLWNCEVESNLEDVSGIAYMKLQFSASQFISVVKFFSPGPACQSYKGNSTRILWRRCFTSSIVAADVGFMVTWCHMVASKRCYKLQPLNLDQHSGLTVEWTLKLEEGQFQTLANLALNWLHVLIGDL